MSKVAKVLEDDPRTAILIHTSHASCLMPQNPHFKNSGSSYVPSAKPCWQLKSPHIRVPDIGALSPGCAPGDDIREASHGDHFE